MSRVTDSFESRAADRLTICHWRLWVVQRRPVVGDQGQRCVEERSLEPAPTAMDRMAAVGRRPFGGQGRPEPACGDRLLPSGSLAGWPRRRASA